MRAVPQPRACFLLRFPSGLRSLVAEGRWEPSGSPAIVRLLEAWCRRHAATIIFVGKAPADTEALSRTRACTVAALGNARITIHPFRRWMGIARVDVVVNTCVQWWSLALRIIRDRPAILYCDRSNLFLGAIVAWTTPVRVVVRMLGVAKLSTLCMGRWSAVMHPLYAWAFRAPFAAIVCSEDGSPGREVLERCARRTRACVVWLNGADSTRTPLPRPIGGTRRIVFVGRLEPGKGVEDFLASLAHLRHDGNVGLWEAWIVGDGSLRGTVDAQVRACGLGSVVRVRGAVPHAAIGEILASTDIAVSLNTLGNLSNVVLEALANGCCTVVLGSDGMRDRVTRVLLRDAALTVDPTDTVASLAEILRRCMADDTLVRRHAAAARAFAAARIPRWSERIAREVALLERIVAARASSRDGARSYRTRSVV